VERKNRSEIDEEAEEIDGNSVLVHFVAVFIGFEVSLNV
jgi:hypothetical protein